VRRERGKGRKKRGTDGRGEKGEERGRGGRVGGVYKEG